VKPQSSLLFGSEDISRLDTKGSILLLDSKKDGAFRAGVPGKRGEWSRENRGPYSVAFGERTIARGRGAFVHGSCSEVGGQWNTSFGTGVNVADSVQIQNNLVGGSGLSLTSTECGRVDSNTIGGKCNTVAASCASDSNTIGGSNNAIVDSGSNLVQGCSNKVKECQRNLIQGHCHQLEGIHDSLVVGVGHSNTCHTGASIVSGSYNKTGPHNCDGMTVGTGLYNNMQGVILVGRNGEARTSPSFNYSFQLAGGCEGSRPGVGLVLHTASHGHVPVQNGIATGNWQSSCTGYSEYFEWHDCNPNNEDRVGLFVSLNKDKIILATSTRDVVGVVTWSAAFVGNSHELAWHQANLKDDYGRYCFEFEDDYDGIICLLRRYLNPEKENDEDESCNSSDRRSKKEDEGLRESRDKRDRRDRRDRKDKKDRDGSDRSEGRRSGRRNSDDYSERSRRLSDDYSERSESYSDRSENGDSRGSIRDSRSDRSDSELSDRSSRDRSSDRRRKENGDTKIRIEANLHLSLSLQIYRSLCELPRDSSFIRRCCERLPWLKDEITKIPKKRVNKLNKGYRSDNYCPRSDRKEWETVTLIGRVTVRQNGSCREGEKVDCVNGLAVPGSGWRVLKVLNSQTVQILFTGPATRRD